jgi:predicted RNase H-like HicB family nuclease
VPALPGCATQGETFEEAQDMIRDAIKGYLLTLRDIKEHIPSESTKMIVTQIPVTISS